MDLKRLFELDDLLEHLLVLKIGLTQFFAGLLIFRFRRYELIFIGIRGRVGEGCFQPVLFLIELRDFFFQFLELWLVPLQFLLRLFIYGLGSGISHGL